ncbi:hypothetical protein DENIS_2559 [Desulfonema ishimotonii]|uniref:Uncharacterized protein n=1 Tax=Desulfonema ishimotonii TaxID=45657 RepID=A0A401FX88_9BACT|nr:hypothetical protein DENIS_2559 [Desulfonema ishimotonii]
MKIGDGPAAVIGDEICDTHCSFTGEWEEAEIRMIRKSEDLPWLRAISCGVSGIGQT